MVAATNIVLGVSLGIYTGILLSALGARPFWSSAILGPLFLVSGLSIVSSSSASAGLPVGVLPTTIVPRSRLEAGLSPAGLFTEVGLTPSRKEAKRMIEQGGLYVNDRRVDSAERLLTLADLGPDGGLILKAGKKKVHRVVPG